jgi:prepilin-type N-terminal cleavage/methylation domain-containing protein
MLKHKSRSLSLLADQGFTLIEVIASILIVSVILAATSPVLALIAFRRAASERAEIASQLTRAEIDRIRAIVDIELARDPSIFDVDRLPVATAGALDQVIPPTRIPPITDANTLVDEGAYSARFVEVSSLNRTEEFVVQVFRDRGVDCTNRNTQQPIAGVPCAFNMGVRVYQRLSFDQGGDAIAGLEREVSPAFRTLANAEAWRFPVASSEVAINVASDLSEICENLAGAACAAFQ